MELTLKEVKKVTEGEELQEMKKEWLVKKLAENSEKYHIAEACKSFKAFRKYFLGQPFEDAPLHQELMEDVERFSRMVRATPRGFAKTTICARDYILYLALTGKVKDILYVSDTASLAIETLDRVKKELALNSKIVEVFGVQDQTSEKWQQEYAVLSNGVKIRSRGKGYQIRGFHPLVVILDDLENDESVRSESQRAFLEDWFFKALLGAVDEKAQVICLGTIISPLCLLQKIIERVERRELPWSAKVYKARIPEPGQPTLWPARWSREQLIRRKTELGEAGYASEYLNEPISVKDPIIQKSWIQYEECPRYPEGHQKSGQFIPLFYYTAWDPAISKADKADETAKVTVGVVSEGLHQGEIHVMEAAKKKVSMLETVEWALKSFDRWSDRLIGVETVAYQKALKETLLLEGRKRGRYLPVVELKADKDKVRRLKEVSPLIESGQVKFHRGQDTLIQQLVTVSESGTSGDDDLVDALVYALRLVKERPSVTMLNVPRAEVPVYQPAMTPIGVVSAY